MTPARNDIETIRSASPPQPAPERRPLGLGSTFETSAAGQDERKYSTTNPVVRRLIDRLCRTVADRLSTAAASTADATVPSATIVDVGTGEGLAIQRVLGNLGSRTTFGIEYRADKAHKAKQNVDDLEVLIGDIGTLPFRDRGVPTVLCMEVLEHLDQPMLAAGELARITQSTAVITVPFEPFFRLGNLARGKNINRFGNDPEHVQQFNRSSLRALLGEHFDSVDVSVCFPWLIAVCQNAPDRRSEPES